MMLSHRPLYYGTDALFILIVLSLTDTIVAIANFTWRLVILDIHALTNLVAVYYDWKCSSLFFLPLSNFVNFSHPRLKVVVF